MTTELPQISEREREILSLVARGATNQQIAQELTISINTVKVHLRNIFGKIGAASRTEATVYAIKQGLVPLADAALPMGAISAPLAVEAVEAPETLPVLPAALAPAHEDALTKLVAPPQTAQVADVVPQMLATPEAHVPKSASVVLVPSAALPGRGRTLLLIVLVVAGLLAATLAGYFLRPVATPVPTAATAQPLAQPQPRWTKRAPLPDQRMSFALASYDRALYVIGGTRGGSISGALARYNLGDNTWTTLGDKPTPVAAACAVAIGGRLYVAGGERADGTPVATFEMYDTRTQRWEKLPDLQAARSRYACATVEGKLYVLGGWDGKNYNSDVFAFDPTSNTWTTLSPLPTPRRNASAAVVDGTIYVVGGEDRSGPLRANERFKPFEGANGVWEKEEPLPSQIGAPAAVGLLASLSVIDPSLATIHSFTPANQTWTTKSYKDIPFSSEATGSNTSIFVFGPPDPATGSVPLNEFQGIYPTFLPGTIAN